MIAYVRTILSSQFEAALCMLNECVARCPLDHWASPIASASFRQVAYHALFFADLYLSPSLEAFVLRDLHSRGGDERQPKFALGLEQPETLTYVALCRQKAIETLAGETPESLAGPSGFPWYPVTRGELHLINLRHLQHHTGQLSAFLRRERDDLKDSAALRWVGAGWRDSGPTAG